MEPPITPSPLQIRLFGPFDARVEDQPLRPLRSRKGQWLLALLTLRHDREVSRGWLAGTLWPDSAEAQGFTSLRVALNDLRAALGSQADRLRSPTPHTLSLDFSECFCDCLAFDRMVAREDTSSLEEAVSLYRGSLLEGCTEEWVMQERMLREQAYLKALEALGKQALERGDPTAAVRWLRRSAAADPYQDTAHQLLMQALAASGDYAAAMMVYRDFRLHLRRELNAEPSPETTALFQHLRDAARTQVTEGEKGRRGEGENPIPNAQRPTPHFSICHVPRPLTRLVGREDEVQAIKSLLRDGRLVTLTGTGGIGKTRLAIQVAEEVAEDYADGAWFVDLAPLSDPSLVPQITASTLGLKEEPNRSLTETLTAFLRDKRLLLVLDNCEHLLEACARLTSELLRVCAGLRLLATSRQALGLSGERAWRVPSLSLPEDSGDATSLLEYEAVRLFVERAIEHHSRFEVSSRNAEAVVQVCRRLDGIALALELAAARVKVLSVEQIAARLDDRFRLLTSGSQDALPRQQTLRAMLDWSYDLLTEEEKALLRHLAVFAGGCTLEAAMAIGGLEEFVALDLVEQLADKSLVNVEAQTGGQARYRLLETIRQFGLERLMEAGEAEAIRQKHLDYFLRLVEEAEPHLRGPEKADWLDRLETEHDNLRVALQGAVEGETRLRLVEMLWWFWHIRGPVSEGRGWMENALARGDSAPVELRAKVLFGAGALAWNQSDYAAAQAYFEESLAFWEQVGDKNGMARALNSLGVVALGRGDYAAARRLHERSLIFTQEMGNRYATALCLNNLGNAARAQGDYTAARDLFEQSLAIHREMKSSTNAGNALVSLGHVACELDDLEAAQSYVTEGLALFRLVGEKRGLLYALNISSDIALIRGDDRAARLASEEALAISREVGNRNWEADDLNRLGLVALSQGDWAAARSCLTESLRIRHEDGILQALTDSVAAFAALAAAQGQAARAARLWGWAMRPQEGSGPEAPAVLRAMHDRYVSGVREALGEATFAAAWAEGQAIKSEQAIEYALKEEKAQEVNLL